MSRTRALWLLASLVGLAFVLRIYRLDTVSLRGDEAFAVRYWADDPAQVLRDLAKWEPHPLGTFFSFWAWKSLAGDSEFAMRYYPLLGNLIGVAAVAALGRRLFHHWAVGLLAALLWAINPFLIWHAQDVRNYAIWAGISPLALWLFLRAAQHNRPRDWLLYLLVEAVAVYIFFLEALLIVVQGVYLLAAHRDRPTLRRAALTWIALAVIMIPWFIQVGYLAQSDYQGTTQDADPVKLLTWFLPTLLTGRDFAAPWQIILPLLWIGLVLRSGDRRSAFFAAWILIPTLLLLIASTRMAIFHPRYLVAIAPALLLLTARAPLIQKRSLAQIAALALLLTPLPGIPWLIDYYQGESAKSADWRALAAYLDTRARPGDLILQTAPDPSFAYYYRGHVAETSLKSGAAIADQIEAETAAHHTIWLVGRSPDAESALRDRMQEISTHAMSNFTVIQYRSRDVSGAEIAVSTDAVFSANGVPLARLVGYTLLGPDPYTQATTLLLYWEPLANADNVSYRVFVHLIRPNTPLNGIPRWNQDDHPPFDDPIATTHWYDSARRIERDIYHLLDDPARILDPGTYEIRVGFYDPNNPSKRLLVESSDGGGDTFVLPGAAITAP